MQTRPELPRREVLKDKNLNHKVGGQMAPLPKVLRQRPPPPRFSLLIS